MCIVQYIPYSVLNEPTHSEHVHSFIFCNPFCDSALPSETFFLASFVISFYSYLLPFWPPVYGIFLASYYNSVLYTYKKNLFIRLNIPYTGNTLPVIVLKTCNDWAIYCFIYRWLCGSTVLRLPSIPECYHTVVVVILLICTVKNCRQ